MVLTSLFSRSASAIKTDEENLDRLWREYEGTVPLKRQAVVTHTGKDLTVILERLLKTDLIDVEKEAKTLDDIDAEMHLREHARNIRSIERLSSALYDTDTIHDFVHGLLAHLFIVLQREHQLLGEMQAASEDEETEKRLRASFLQQLTSEERIIETVREQLRTFAKLLGEMLRGEQTALSLSSNTASIVTALRQRFNAVVLSKTTGDPLAKDIDVINVLVRVEAQRLYDSGELYANEALAERMHDIDVWLVNQPSFVGVVKNALSPQHAQLGDDFVLAFVTVYREYIHEFGLPLPQ